MYLPIAMLRKKLTLYRAVPTAGGAATGAVTHVTLAAGTQQRGLPHVHGVKHDNLHAMDIRRYMQPILRVSMVRKAVPADAVIQVLPTHVLGDGPVVDSLNFKDLRCSNCKERAVGTNLKCGFDDWCNFCDESLWSTNPDVICLGSVCSNCKERAVGTNLKCGYDDWCNVCDESLWRWKEHDAAAEDRTIAGGVDTSSQLRDDVNATASSANRAVGSPSPQVPRKRVRVVPSSSSDEDIPSDTQRHRIKISESDISENDSAAAKPHQSLKVY